MKPKLSDVLSHAVLLLGAAIMLMPFVWMFFTAIKAPSEIFEASIWPWPRTWYGWGHFQEVLKTAPMGQFMWNGLVVCTGILIVQLLVAIPAMVIPSLLGAKLYTKISDVAFRRLILIILSATGIALLISSVPKLI